MFNKRLRTFSYMLALGIAIPAISFAQKDVLRTNIAAISAQSKGTVGVSVRVIEDADTFAQNGNKHLPMQSVFKFPIAMAVLHLIDQKQFTIDKKVHIDKAMLLPKTHSPLRDKYPNGNVDVPISELIQFMVSESDNNACDILVKIAGGPKKIEDFIHSIGVKDISIKTDEHGMAQAWNIQYTNWATPNAMTELLEKFYHGKALSKASNDFLWKTMLATSTGPQRIKAGLPAGTTWGHKTGTSGTEKGLTAATNDAGIIVLPNGKHVAITVFLSDSKADEASREGTLAAIGKAVYEYAVKK